MKQRLITTRDSDESDKPESNISDSYFSHSNEEVMTPLKAFVGYVTSHILHR